MNRIGQINMIIGFVIIFIAAAGGSFLAQDITNSFVRDQEHLNSWELTLLTSAHGHTNLFGFLHILYGLTIPYSAMSKKFKNLQTCGIFAGSLSMSLGMFFNAIYGPNEGIGFLSILLGTGLSLALIAIGTHAIGLFLKLRH